VPGTPREVCERALVPTTRRLLVLRKGGIAVVNYDDCEPFEYRRLGMQGLLTVRPAGHTGEYSMHWTGARALSELLNQLRAEFRASPSGSGLQAGRAC
jgi:hypothetical protein